MERKPTFCFLDESGVLKTDHPEIRYFGIGAIIHSHPDNLIENLHSEFEGLCSTLRKDPTRLEFKASEIKKSSAHHYSKCLKILADDPGWRFCSIIIDLDDPKFQAPTNPLEVWEGYLRFMKLMLQKNLKPEEQTILVADYLRRPKGPVHRLETLPKIVPQLNDVLQVESQGVLLVQMADVLLGSSQYQGKDSVKQKLASEVASLRNSIGRSRFNEWNIKWN